MAPQIMPRVAVVTPACGLLAAGLLMAAAGPASGQSRCKVTDPTGTPLNVRVGPQGAITGTVKNGTLVRIEGSATDSKGRHWAYVSDFESGKSLGWVFREFVSCY